MPTPIVTRQKRKSISLSINAEGQIVVKAPRFLPLFAINQFVKQHETWIQKKLQISKKQSYFGKNYDVTYQFQPISRSKFYKIQNTFQIILPDYYREVDDSLIAQEIYKTMHTWVHRSMKEELTKRVEMWSTKLGYSYNNISVKDVSSHWGSCSSNKNLNFNYKLAFLPEELIDYVIVHELCHLVEMNHSPRFWQLVETWIPDYKKRRKMLKKCRI